MSNTNLNRAKYLSVKNDEFYTKYEDIEKEVHYYKKSFEDKVVYCNCDIPNKSNFGLFFLKNFHSLGLKKLIVSGYDPQKNSCGFYSEVRKDEQGTLTGLKSENLLVVNELNYDGDFRKPQSIDILEEIDIVVTNPPFSLLEDFLYILLEKGKQFLVIGNINIITNKKLFPYLMEDKFWFGVNRSKMTFSVPKDICPSGEKSLNNTRWITNLPIEGYEKNIELTECYDPLLYPHYENYNAIEVSRIKNIPKDYEGIMGVPITFFDNHNKDQFEIVGTTYPYGVPKECKIEGKNATNPIIDGKRRYKRLFIRKCKN